MELEQPPVINKDLNNEKFIEPEWMIILTKLIQRKPELIIQT